MRRLFRAIPSVCLAAAMLFLVACTKEEKPAPQAKAPTVAEVLNQGIEALKHNNLDLAIKAFSAVAEKAPSEAPERPMAYLYLGQIAYRAGNMDLAAQNFQEVAKLRPDFSQGRLSLGNAYFAGGKVDQAIEVWEALAHDQPNLASVHNNLGIAYSDKGDMDKAISHLEQTIALSPDNYRAHENLAAAYRKKGMTAEAEATDRKAQAIKARLMAAQAGDKAAPEEPGKALAESP